MQYRRQTTLEDFESTWTSESPKPTPAPKPTIIRIIRTPETPAIDVADGRVNIGKFRITIRGEP